MDEVLLLHQTAVTRVERERERARGTPRDQSSRVCVRTFFHSRFFAVDSYISHLPFVSVFNLLFLFVHFIHFFSCSRVEP